MIVFPNSKINLGLNVVARREDGFHDIVTAFYPLSWCDALELIRSDSAQPFEFSQSGLSIPGTTEDNIVYKAWKALSSIKKLPSIKVHLHKHVPMGAGLGGGSSNAAAFIKAANRLLELGLSDPEQIQLVSSLGSDCAFFINGSPVLATGRGEQMRPLDVDLGAYHILAVHPGIHSDTSEAYAGIVPARPDQSVPDLLELPVHEWRHHLHNDFEHTIFSKHPVIKDLKELLYQQGAIYASMSGSGSAVYGIFNTPPDIRFRAGFRWHLQKPTK